MLKLISWNPQFISSRAAFRRWRAFFFFTVHLETLISSKLYMVFSGFCDFPCPISGFSTKVANPAKLQIWSLKHKNFPKFAEDLACLWRNNTHCENWIEVIPLEKKTSILQSFTHCRCWWSGSCWKPVKDMKKIGEIMEVLWYVINLLLPILACTASHLASFDGLWLIFPLCCSYLFHHNIPTCMPHLEISGQFLCWCSRSLDVRSLKLKYIWKRAR